MTVAGGRPSSGAPPAPAVDLSAVGAIGGVAAALGRQDLVDRLQAAVARASRPTTIVCVVGEFKQGKSSLVNGLLGETVCPEDDDMATCAITLVHHAPDRRLVVRRREGSSSVSEAVDPARLDELVTEQGNPENRLRVERVDVGLPHPLLASGLSIVDTPGVGGLAPGPAAATLAFLPFCDAVLFVSDATSELTAPEVAFLAEAAERCPTVVLCLTKIDLQPAWREIGRRNAGHVERAGIRTPIAGLSAAVRRVAVTRQDDALDTESGFPALLGHLERRVVATARDRAAARAVDDAQAAAAQLRLTIDGELAGLGDRAAAEARLVELTDARQRLDHLRGPAARWATVMNDRMADASSEATHQLRGALRQVSRRADEALTDLADPDAWEALSRELQVSVATAVADAFDVVSTHVTQLSADLARLIEDDVGEIDLGLGADQLDIDALWQEKSETASGGRFMEAFSLLRGAQGGLLTFGMLGQVLPGAAAALLMSNPVTLAVGVLFGRQAFKEQRKRKLAQRQQQAQKTVRQFLDDVGFEIGQDLSEHVRTVHRRIRDGVADRIAQLQQAAAASAKRIEDDLRQGDAARAARAEQLRTALGQLDRGLAALAPGAT